MNNNDQNVVTKTIPSDKPSVSLVQRPWGSFKQYASNQDCTVSLMIIQPGQRLSLQSHAGRAELWIVLDDGAIVQVGDPANQKHRLSCRDSQPVRVLEVAFGNWQQDDIKRFDDDYHRSDARQNQMS